MLAHVWTFQSRFHIREAATRVATQMRRLTNAEIEVLHSPVDEQDRKRGIGDWMIQARADEYRYVGRLQAAFDMAMQLALAAELRALQPNNVLLEGTWHLRVANLPPRGELSRLFSVTKD